MNLLFITEIAPFPVNGGEKLRSYGLLRILSKLGYNVTAIIGKSDNEAYKNFKIKNIEFIEFDFKKLRSGNKYINYYKLFRKEKSLIAKIDEILETKSIDLVHIDYSFYGQYISYLKSKELKVIYGTHNAQASLIIQRPSISLKNSLSLKISYIVHHLHERIFFNKADAIITVSENDKNYHQKFVQKHKIYVIPNFLIEEEYPELKNNKKNCIIMTANFKAFQNYIGLEWFIANVWDDELSNKTKLFLIGLGSKETLAMLSNKYNLLNVKAIGKVDDLKPFIAEAKVSIVPLLHGSGSRLKCLESMALKTQIVSTSKGAEGTQHNGTILIADTPKDFKSCIYQVLEGHVDNTKAAYNEFLKLYSLNPNAIIYNQMVKKLFEVIKKNCYIQNKLHRPLGR